MATNILFPQWPKATEVLEESAKAEKQAAHELLERNQKAGKMTDAARRKKIYADLVSVLQSDEDAPQKCAELTSILGANTGNKKVTLSERGSSEVAQAAVNHFNRACCELLVEKGLVIPPHMITEKLYSHFDTDLFEYLITLAIATQNNSHPLYQNAISGVYAHMLQKFLDPKPTIRAQARKARERLEGQFPTEIKNLLSSGARHYGSWHWMLNNLLLKYPTDLPVEDVTFIRTIPLDVFDWAFQNVLNLHNFNARDLESFNRFLSDFPMLAQQWKTLERTKHTQNTEWQTFWRAQLPQGETNLEKTPLHDTIARLLEKEHRVILLLPDGSVNIDKSNITNFKQINLSITGHLDTRLGFDLYDRFAFYGEKIAVHSGYSQNRFTSSAHTFGGLVQTLISKGASALEAFSSHEDGLRILDQHLTHKETLMRFCANAPWVVVNKYLKSRPEYLTWTDAAGNTLGHYLAALRSDKSKSLVIQLARWNHEWLNIPNANGVTIRDIFEDAGAPENVLAVLSKENIKRLMKSQGVAQEKIHARSSAQPKRRM